MHESLQLDLKLYHLNYSSYGKKKREIKNFGDNSQLNGHHHREKRFLFNGTAESLILSGIGASVLAGLALVLVSNPGPPGLVPSDQPQPGTPGGGGLPTENNPGNILDQVPYGLTPIGNSIF